MAVVIRSGLQNLELTETISPDDDSLRARTAYPVSWEIGAASSAVVYFELDPGCHLGTHAHSCEETVLVLEGSVEVSVEEESTREAAGSLMVVPARARHDVRCVGEAPARCVGYFPSASVQTLYEQRLGPDGERVQGTPVPDRIEGL